MRALFPLVSTLALSLALGACTEQKPEAERPRPVKTMVVAPSPSTVELSQTGEIQPRVETDVGFLVEGRMTARLVEIGQTVKPGDVIATLDDTRLANDLRAAEADLASAATSADLARINLDRQRQLFERDIVARARFEEAESNARVAESRRVAAASTLANARRRVEYARLTATTAGVVTAIGANTGQVVSAGQMVVRIAATLEKDAVFHVSEQVITRVPDDVVVSVALVSDPAVTARGTVREVSPAADPTTRTYRVRVTLVNPPARMTLGASIVGRVDLPTEPLVALPAAALAALDGKPAVFTVATATGQLSLKPVEIARYTDGEIFVSSGLQNGDVVVVAGVTRLRPSQIVTYPQVQ